MNIEFFGFNLLFLLVFVYLVMLATRLVAAFESIATSFHDIRGVAKDISIALNALESKLPPRT